MRGNIRNGNIGNIGVESSTYRKGKPYRWFEGRYKVHKINLHKIMNFYLRGKSQDSGEIKWQNTQGKYASAI